MIGLFRPQNLNWITLSGPDARDFLHRLTTVNVKALKPGHGAPGFFLNPQGKVRAYFYLWNLGSPDEFAFEVSSGISGTWKQELLAVIDQFTFAEKMTLTETQHSTLWVFNQEVKDLQPGQTLAIEPELRACHHNTRDFGGSWISLWGSPVRIQSWLERNAPQAAELSEQELEIGRIQALHPGLDTEITPNTVPLDVGLIDAIAENKGCYPGQEVIEKIISLGSPARRLVKIEGRGPAPQKGSKVLGINDPATEMGEVTSSAALGTDQYVALAVIKKMHAQKGTDIRWGNVTEPCGKITAIARYKA